MFRQQRPQHAHAIKVGTDCSGMEAPLRALKQLNVPFIYEFGCDINQHCKAQCQASGFVPKIWYKSIFDRDCRTVPAVDLYVAGFPCQPHSTAGARRGGGDPRSQVFDECAKYINTHNPAVFLLENVKGIMSVQKGQMWQHILLTLRDSGDLAYNIFYTVLNTEEHGVPQHRPRLYILGLRSDVQKERWTWPPPLPHVSIEAFLEPSAAQGLSIQDLPLDISRTCRSNLKRELERLEKEGMRPLQRPFLSDVDSSPGWVSVMWDRCPCLTRSRPQGFWISNRGRRMSVKEMLRLQGMQSMAANLDGELAVTERQLGQMIGNSMSQNVLERILARVMKCAFGLSVRDKWAAAASRCQQNMSTSKRRRVG